MMRITYIFIEMCGNPILLKVSAYLRCFLRDISVLGLELATAEGNPNSNYLSNLFRKNSIQSPDCQ